MSILLWVIMVVGFSTVLIFEGGIPDYYGARLMIHGLINFLWFTLLIVQTSLIRSKNQNIHKTIGMFGMLYFILVSLNVIFIFYTTYARRGNFIAVDWMVLFQFIVGITIIYIGFRNRKQNLKVHKDYVLFGSFCLIQPAINRLASVFGEYYVFGFIVISLIIVLLFVLYWKKINWLLIAWLFAWGAGSYLRFIH